MASPSLTVAAGSPRPAMDLRCRRLAPQHVPDLVSFLGRLATDGDDRLFHPHPFTHDAVAALATPGRIDEYVVVTMGPQRPILAYGMLRGWEDGFEIPSLGIAVERRWRGLGVGRRLASHLHAIAVARGAPAVRLKVYRSNAAAIALYQSFGYVFRPHSPDEWLGLVATTHLDAAGTGDTIAAALDGVRRRAA